MNDDSDLPEEYWDYLKVPRRDFGLDDNDRQLYKELNKIRYKFDRGYISEEKFFKQIDYPEFYGFLTEYEWSELNKRADEEKQRKKVNEEEAKRKSESRKEQINEVKVFLLLVFLLIIIIITIMSIAMP